MNHFELVNLPDNAIQWLVLLRANDRLLTNAASLGHDVSRLTIARLSILSALTEVLLEPYRRTRRQVS